MNSLTERPKVRLFPKQTIAWDYLEDNETTELLYGGGAGPGKSFLGCLWHIHRRKTYPLTRGLIGRAKLSNLKESTIVTFWKVCAELGYIAGIDYKYNSQEHFVEWDNGSRTVFKDLFQYPSDPDFVSLGSSEYTDAFIDEGTEITQRAFEIVKSRLRWMTREYGLMPKILITSNPGDGWLKERFVLKDNKPVQLEPYQKFVRALLSDNKNEGFKQDYRKLLDQMTNDYDKQRLIHGDWEAQREVMRPFMHQYEPQKHESKSAVFQDEKPIFISIDFNINPFAVNFGHMWRDDIGEHFHIFDEMDIMHGSIPAMVERIKAKYGNKLSSCKITGDASGNKGEISQRDNASNYVQLMRGLGISSKQLEVPKANPLHENSMADCNHVLCHFPDFSINPDTCSNTCRDMRTVQVDAFNKIIKRNRLDTAQQADHMDCVRYGINTWLKPWIEWHQKLKK